MGKIFLLLIMFSCGIGQGSDTALIDAPQYKKRKGSSLSSSRTPKKQRTESKSCVICPDNDPHWVYVQKERFECFENERHSLEEICDFEPKSRSMKRYQRKLKRRIDILNQEMILIEESLTRRENDLMTQVVALEQYLTYHNIHGNWDL